MRICGTVDAAAASWGTWPPLGSRGTRLPATQAQRQRQRRRRRFAIQGVASPPTRRPCGGN